MNFTTFKHKNDSVNQISCFREAIRKWKAEEAM